MKLDLELRAIKEEQLRILKNCILSQRLTANDLKVVVMAMDDPFIAKDEVLEDLEEYE